MKKCLLIQFILCAWFNTHSQPRMNLYYEAEGDAYVIWVDNMEPCPISVDVRLKLKNMTSSAGEAFLAVVPAQTSQYEITRLTVDNFERSSRFEYDYISNLGDQTLVAYERDYPYQLPCASKSKVLVMQGYNGQFSHQNKQALDFDMKLGSPVHAARGGVVVRVVEINNRGCADEVCAKYNNYVLIYHPDGSFAEYTHLKQYGGLVDEGDRVTDGELIGYSGNTGWSSGPHLHFVVFLQRLDYRETIPTRFRVGDGSEEMQLNEGEAYYKGY